MLPIKTANMHPCSSNCCTPIWCLPAAYWNLDLDCGFHCSNGHVCLDILYDGRNGGWSPALTINKVVMSLRSMLASNQDKVGLLHCS